MSDDTTTPEETAPEADAPEQPFDPDIARQRIDKANREAKQLRERLKALEPLAKKAQEIEEAQKTEAQRAAEALTAAEKRAADSERRALLLEVAAEKGLTAGQAKRLVGTTREELLVDADDYLASLPPTTPPPASRTPVAALRPGALPNPAPLSLDDQIAAASKAGDFRAVIALQNQKLANHTA